MPLVASGLPPAAAPARVIDLRRVEFVSLDGSRVFDWGGRECFVLAGWEGADLAAPDLLTARSGSGYYRLDEIRSGMREMAFPVHLNAANHLDLLGLKASLRAFFAWRGVDYRGADGTFDVVAHNGYGGSRRLRCVYKSGMEGVYGHGDGSWVTLPLVLLSVDPDWHGEPWSTPIVRLPISSPFLTTVGTRASPLRLTSSIALGTDMPVTVGGDIPSPVTVEIGGPATSTHITSPQGLDVTVGALTSGQTFRLETGRRKRALLNGVSAGSLLSSGPQWRPLPPGGASISVEVTGATSETWARVFGESLWETPW